MAKSTVLETAECLKLNRERILALWSERVRQEIPAADGKSEPVLRDAFPLFLIKLVCAISPNRPEDASTEVSVSREHAIQRDEQGDYSLKQMIAEYFLLQKTIFEVIEVETCRPLPSTDRDIIIDAIAVGIKEAGAKFSELQLARLQRSNESLEHFAHIASHDLREPLRTMSMHLALVQRQMGAALPPETKRSMDYVTQASARMRDLVDSLMAYSQVGHDEARKAPTDFNVAVQTAVSNLAEAVRESGARISWDTLPTLPAIGIEIERLFQNLIGNAIKFRSAAVPIIHISATETGDRWHFSVSDNGIGIPVMEKDRVFELFSRLRPEGGVPGSGIGLSVCRRVVELHGGTIRYGTNSDGGTTFEFTIAATSR